MSIVDIVIIVFVIIGFMEGYSRGLIHELLSLFGFIIAAIIAFLLKDNLSVLLYQKLPFFNLNFIFKGASVLNILIYELIAFLVIMLIALYLIHLLKMASVLIKALLNNFKVISFPFKLTGGLIGTIKAFLIAIIVIIGLNFFNINYLEKSIIMKNTIDNAVLFKEQIKDKLVIIDEVYEVKESIKNDDSDLFNYKTLDLFINKGIISVDNAKLLRDKNKLNFNGIDELIERYELNDSK